MNTNNNNINEEDPHPPTAITTTSTTANTTEEEREEEEEVEVEAAEAAEAAAAMETHLHTEIRRDRTKFLVVSLVVLFLTAAFAAHELIYVQSLVLGGGDTDNDHRDVRISLIQVITNHNNHTQQVLATGNTTHSAIYTFEHAVDGGGGSSSSSGALTAGADGDDTAGAGGSGGEEKGGGSSGTSTSGSSISTSSRRHDSSSSSSPSLALANEYNRHHSPSLHIRCEVLASSSSSDNDNSRRSTRPTTPISWAQNPIAYLMSFLVVSRADRHSCLGVDVILRLEDDQIAERIGAHFYSESAGINAALSSSSASGSSSRSSHSSRPSSSSSSTPFWAQRTFPKFCADTNDECWLSRHMTFTTSFKDLVPPAWWLFRLEQEQDQLENPPPSRPSQVPPGEQVQAELPHHLTPTFLGEGEVAHQQDQQHDSENNAEREERPPENDGGTDVEVNAPPRLPPLSAANSPNDKAALPGGSSSRGQERLRGLLEKEKENEKKMSMSLDVTRSDPDGRARWEGWDHINYDESLSDQKDLSQKDHPDGGGSGSSSTAASVDDRRRRRQSSTSSVSQRISRMETIRHHDHGHDGVFTSRIAGTLFDADTTPWQVSLVSHWSRYHAAHQIRDSAMRRAKGLGSGSDSSSHQSGEIDKKKLNDDASMYKRVQIEVRAGNLPRYVYVAWGVLGTASVVVLLAWSLILVKLLGPQWHDFNVAFVSPAELFFFVDQAQREAEIGAALPVVYGAPVTPARLQRIELSERMKKEKEKEKEKERMESNASNKQADNGGGSSNSSDSKISEQQSLHERLQARLNNNKSNFNNNNFNSSSTNRPSSSPSPPPPPSLVDGGGSGVGSGCATTPTTSSTAIQPPTTSSSTPSSTHTDMRDMLRKQMMMSAANVDHPSSGQQHQQQQHHHDRSLSRSDHDSAEDLLLPTGRTGNSSIGSNNSSIVSQRGALLQSGGGMNHHSHNSNSSHNNTNRRPNPPPPLNSHTINGATAAAASSMSNLSTRQQYQYQRERASSTGSISSTYSNYSNYSSSSDLSHHSVVYDDIMAGRAGSADRVLVSGRGDRGGDRDRDRGGDQHRSAASRFLASIPIINTLTPTSVRDAARTVLLGRSAPREHRSRQPGGGTSRRIRRARSSRSSRTSYQHSMSGGLSADNLRRRLDGGASLSSSGAGRSNTRRRPRRAGEHGPQNDQSLSMSYDYESDAGSHGNGEEPDLGGDHHLPESITREERSGSFGGPVPIMSSCPRTPSGTHPYEDVSSSNPPQEAAAAAAAYTHCSNDACSDDEDDSDDEDEIICRICQEFEPRNDLFAPCRCAGTSKYVHRECLHHWRSATSNPAHRDECAECKHKYTYKEDESKRRLFFGPGATQALLGEMSSFFKRQLQIFLTACQRVACLIVAFLLGGYCVKVAAAAVTWDWVNIKWQVDEYHVIISLNCALSIVVSAIHLLYFFAGYPLKMVRLMIVGCGVGLPVFLGYVGMFWVWMLNCVVWEWEVSYGVGSLVLCTLCGYALPGFLEHVHGGLNLESLYRAIHVDADQEENDRRFMQRARELLAATTTSPEVGDGRDGDDDVDVDVDGGSTGRRSESPPPAATAMLTTPQSLQGNDDMEVEMVEVEGTTQRRRTAPPPPPSASSMPGGGVEEVEAQERQQQQQQQQEQQQNQVAVDIN